MLKFFGGIMIFCVCTYYGFYSADRLKKRRDFLGKMISVLQFISLEIEYGRYDLCSIFKRIDNSGLNGFFAVCIANIDCGIRCAWKKAVEKSGEGLLKREETDILSQLGNEIGMSDVPSQKKSIARTVSGLDLIYKASDDEYTRLSKVYRNCGVLLGVFFLIILA